MDLQKPKEKIIIFLASFLIILFFSFNFNFHLDEAISLYCSKFYFEDCIGWDAQFPTFYFWLRFLSLITFRIDYLRIFSSIIVAFSIYIIVRIVSKYKNFSFKQSLLLSILLSLIPAFFSSTTLRPYVFSMFFASLSANYFFDYLKNKKYSSYFKSIIFDFFSSAFFIFNLLLIFPKLIFAKNKIKILSLLILFALILLPFIYITFLRNSPTKLESISWYKNVEGYGFFWFNFPVTLFKQINFEEFGEKNLLNFTLEKAGIKNYSIFTFLHLLIIVFAKLAQIMFILPFFSLTKKEIKKFYTFNILLVIIISIVFYLFLDVYLTLSRQFIAFGVYILLITLISLPIHYSYFLIISLLFYFSFQINYIVISMFDQNLYNPSIQVYSFLEPNSSIIVHPFTTSYIFWYLESINKKNIEIIDSLDLKWYEKDVENVIFRKWSTEKQVTFYKIESIKNKTKVFFDELPINCSNSRVFYSFSHKIYICQ